VWGLGVVRMGHCTVIYIYRNSMLNGFKIDRWDKTWAIEKAKRLFKMKK
jgi:hypothetical protein